MYKLPEYHTPKILRQFMKSPSLHKENLRFVPDHTEPQLLDVGNDVFTGPPGFVDPQSGRTISFTIAQDSVIM